MALDGVGHALDAGLCEFVLRLLLQRVKVLRGPVLVALQGLAARGTELGGEEEVGIRVRLGKGREGRAGLLELLLALQSIGASDDGDVRKGGVVPGLGDKGVVDREGVFVARRVVVGLREAQAQGGADLGRTVVGNGRFKLVHGVGVHERLVRPGIASAQPVAPGVEAGNDKRGDEQHRHRGLPFLHPPVPYGEQFGRRLHEGGQVLVGGLLLFTHGFHLVSCTLDGTARPTDPAHSRRALPCAPRCG